jgi:hypothetical protein
MGSWGAAVVGTVPGWISLFQRYITPYQHHIWWRRKSCKSTTSQHMYVVLAFDCSYFGDEPGPRPKQIAKHPDLAHHHDLGWAIKTWRACSFNKYIHTSIYIQYIHAGTQIWYLSFGAKSQSLSLKGAGQNTTFEFSGATSRRRTFLQEVVG